jgi:predicted nuclease of restriction endonuclease-like (RecB) superfamily
LAFHRAYLNPFAIVQQPVAQLPGPSKLPQPVAKSRKAAIVQQPAAQLAIADSLLWNIPWGHHGLLLARVNDLPTRIWYMQQTISQGWSRNSLSLMIGSRAHERQGQLVSNFANTLPAPQSDLVQQIFKDPYIFDFLTLEEPFHERELETGLVQHLQKFLLELGQGFAFVGRQYRFDVGDQDFYVDLLFYHLHLRSFVVIDLKTGDFKPEYAGKMNFYCSTADAQLRHKTDQPTIGLILCQTKERIIAEYALRDIHKPIGVAEYELTRALPKELASSLPSIEQIEAEMQRELDGKP